MGLLLTIAIVVIGFSILMMFIKTFVKVGFWILALGLVMVGIHFVLRYFGVL